VNTAEHVDNSELTTWALQCLNEGQLDELRIGLSDLHPSQLSLLLESVPGDQRVEIVNLLPEAESGSARYSSSSTRLNWPEPSVCYQMLWVNH